MISCRQKLFPAALVLVLAVNTLPAQQPPPRSLRDIPLPERRALLKGYPGDWQPDTDRAQGLPAPPRQKSVASDAVRLQLPAPATAETRDITLADALRQRRSHRAYTDESLTLAELSFLLWSVQGVTRKADNDTERSRRTAPSAGALYPLETYVVALRIAGLPPGIHRYLPDTHELVTVRAATDLPARVVAACYGQEFVGTAAAVIAWTAVPERTEWKYAYLAPRMIAMEAGHACQNLYLACETVGAGTCAFLGYDQARLDALLGVDGEDEFTVYLAPLGKVQRQPESGATPRTGR